MLRLALLAVALALAYASMDEHWAIFKYKHGKQYTDEEDATRRAIFEDNWNFIEEHNARYDAGEVTFWVDVNRFADMTSEEFNAKYNTLQMQAPKPSETMKETDASELPDTVDWRDAGIVTDIKDQGDCGSCWSFSTTGSIEGQHALATGELVSLSEQQLVDCDSGNAGCNGGYMITAMGYVRDNGITSEADYPYVGKDQSCSYTSSSEEAATISFMTSLESGSESELQEAVARIGPISIAIDASQMSFQLYAGGVYDEPACTTSYLDHGVLVIGYGTDNGQDYWLVKNSWGTGWGIDGYIEMSRNKDNQCGIASAPSYPIIDYVTVDTEKSQSQGDLTV